MHNFMQDPRPHCDPLWQGPQGRSGHRACDPGGLNPHASRVHWRWLRVPWASSSDLYQSEMAYDGSLLVHQSSGTRHRRIRRSSRGKRHGAIRGLAAKAPEKVVVACTGRTHPTSLPRPSSPSSWWMGSQC